MSENKECSNCKFIEEDKDLTINAIYEELKDIYNRNMEYCKEIEEKDKEIEKLKEIITLQKKEIEN